MNFSKFRARPWGTALLFFVTGVLFASAMDWTPFSHAQGGGPPSKQMAQATKSLGETSDAFAAIAEHVTPAVVAIQTRTNAHTVQPGERGQLDPRIPKEYRQYFEGPGGQQQVPAQEGTGSGFIISQDGYIITNNHVVQDADLISVVMTDRKTYKAKLIGRDPDTDVAVIKIDASGLPTIALGDDERLRIGEWVLAIGNPLGLDFTVTAGIVSAKGRGSKDVPVNGRNYAITDFIQTDAAINPGNSGGPLVNIRGEVVGMNTAIASGSGRYEGYGFAIPVTLARTVWEDLIEHGRVVRPALGVSIDEVTAEDADVAGLKTITGVLIRECNTTSGSSPACQAGVEAGDIITSIDGHTVDRVSSLQRVVRSKKPGDVVDVKLMRYGHEKDYRVKLIQAKTEPDVVADASDRSAKKEVSPASKLGITVEAVTDQFAKAANIEDRYRGLQVTEVTPDGPARGKFSQGDVIVGVMPSGDRIKSEGDLTRALSSKKAGDVISLRVLHTGGTGANTLTVVNLRVGG